MAKVAPNPQLQDTIDHYLDYLIGTWNGIPEVAAEWDDWDDLSQLTYVVNWGVPEDRLHELRGWAEQGLLTPAQRTRYEELLGLEARYRPLVAALHKDDEP